MAEETTKEDIRESQVPIQCRRLAELSAELRTGFHGLEKRLEPALGDMPPMPEEGKTKEALCPLAETLRVIGDSLVGHLTDIRTLTDRIEI